jgi:two-component system, cell cycle sensor histidine kinase and response regulator CckA
MESKFKSTSDNISFVTENLNDMIIRFNTDLRITYLNKSAEILFKNIVFIDRGETYPDSGKGIQDNMIKYLLGKSISQISKSSKLIEFVENSLKFAVQTGEIRSIGGFYNISGNTIYLTTRIIPEKDAQGNIYSILTISNDITENKKMEESLKESEARFRSVFQGVQAIAIQGYNAAGITQYWNSASEMLYGYSEKEAIGKSLLDLIIPPEMKNEVNKAIRYMVETGEPIPAAELMLLKKDGSRVRVLSSHSIVKLKDRPPELFCIDVDLTEQNIIQEKLQKSEDLYRKLVMAIPEVIIRTDIAGNIIFINETSNHIFGLMKKEQIIDKNITYFVAEKDLEKARRNMILMFQKKLGIVEYLLKSEDGREIQCEVNGEVLKDSENNPYGLVFVLRDISERKRIEAELKETNEKLIRAQQVAHIGSWENDYRVRMSYWSEEMYNIMGIEPGIPITFDMAASLFPPEELERRKITLQNALNYNKPYSMDYRIIRKDGKIRYIHTEGEIIRDEKGNAVKMFGTSQDITERKNSEDLLRESEAKFRALFENSKDAICLTKNTIHLFANPAHLRLFGFKSNNEIAGKSILQSAVPEEREKIQKYAEMRYKGETTDEFYETRGLRTDGSEFDTEVHVSTYEFNGEIYTISTIRDITKRKETESALRESEENYREIFNSTSDAIFIDDALTGKMIDINDAVVKLYGYKAKEEILNHNIGDLSANIPPYTEEFAQSYIQKSIEVGQQRFEWLAKRKDGSVFWIEMTLKLTEISGKKIIIATGRDINEKKKNAIALNESETRLRTLINSTPDLICFKDGRGGWLIANDSQIELFSLKNVNFFGKTDAELTAFVNPIYKDSLLCCTESDESAWKGKVIYKGEETITYIDGSKRVYDIIKIPVFEQNGERKGLVLLGRDITERKRIEEALKKSEEKFSLYFEICPEALAITSMETGMYLEVNKAFFELIGHKKEEIINHTSAELNLWVNNDERTRYIGDLIKNGSIRNYEVRYRVKNQEIRNFSVSSEIFEIEGKKWGIHFILDITDRKKAIDALSESEKKYRNLVEQTSDGLLIIDENGNYVDVNDGICRMLGYSREELLKMNMRQLATGEDFEKQQNTFKRMLKGESVITDRRLKCKNGTFLDAELNAKMLSNTRFCAFVRDMTERKMAEIEHLRLQNLESLGVLAGGIAHDFNNILSTILGRATIALDETNDINLKNDLMAIEKACKRAVGLTQQLLTFAKGGAPEKCIVDIQKVIKDTTNFSLSGSNITPEYLFTSDLKIEADPGQMAQVIQNLVINAKQAMPSGGILRIFTEDYIESEKNIFIKITIQDEGIGIPKDQLLKIFDPYFTTKQTGSGLGLSVCHSIITRHDGKITAHSELGKGSTFTIVIPATKKEDNMKDGSAKTTIQKLDILVMDDEEEIRELLTNILLKSGHTVSAACNGEETLALYKEKINKGEHFDLVFMDLTIRGGMGGKETIKKLREIDGNAKVIVSSGYAESSISNYNDDGFDGMLKKPYTKNDLNEAIASVMKK